MSQVYFVLGDLVRDFLGGANDGCSDLLPDCVPTILAFRRKLDRDVRAPQNHIAMSSPRGSHSIIAGMRFAVPRSICSAVHNAAQRG